MIRRSLVIWLALPLLVAGSGSQGAEYPPPREVDVRRAEAAGLRVLEGRYVQLFTDVPHAPAIDELPSVFDAAMPQWAAYFGRDEGSVRGRFLAFLVKDRERFAALGLLPEDNPNYINGYARGHELWLDDQPSDYYRRHLLLHEGTHAFMQTQLGGCGAPWYMEGMAELLGAHSWKEGQLRLGVIPASRDEAPMWGRTKIIRDASAANKAWPLAAVLKVDNSRALSTEHYAWTWALAALLDGHPQFRERFRGLKQFADDPAFQERFREAFRADAQQLLMEWQVFVAEADYGYDIQRMAIVHRPPMVVTDAMPPVAIAADRGWQSTGWLLRGGGAYRIAAHGRYVIAHDSQPWPCEPGGVTIDYHDGHPLGVLIGALHPAPASDPSFAKPTRLGLGATLRPSQDSVLYVRVNDSAAKLADNTGELTIEIKPADPE